MRDQCKPGQYCVFLYARPEVAEQLCDRVGIINKGQLIACGTMDELRQTSGQVGSNLEKLFLELTDAGDAYEE